MAKNSGSRDSVSQREAGEKTASRMKSSSSSSASDRVRAAGSAAKSSPSSSSSKNSGSRDTVAQRKAGSTTAVSLGRSSSGGSNSAGPNNRSSVSRNSSPASSLSQGSGGRSQNSSSQNGAPNQSKMREGGFDALMQQLDAGNNPKAAAAAAMLTDPGVLNQVVRAGMPDTMGLGDWMDSQKEYRQGKIDERAAASPTGDAFQGFVDWNGIGGALTSGLGGMMGGIGDMLGGPAPRIVDPRAPAPGTNNGGLIERTPQAGERDPVTGFIKDPNTGTYYRPDLLPSSATSERLSTPPMPAEAVAQLTAGVTPEQQAALAYGDMGVPMPRSRPATGGIPEPVQPAMAADPWTALNGMPVDQAAPRGEQPINIASTKGLDAAVTGLNTVPGARPIDPNAPVKEPTIWDNAVDMSGRVLESTMLGGVAKNLFPDFWYGAGETMKGGSGGGSLAPVDGQYDRWGDPTSPYNTLVPTTGGGGNGGNGLEGFIDANGNGIDDRLEGYSAPPPGSGAQDPTLTGTGRTVQFPDMPPFNPGIDREWRYFRGNGYAPGYADGGIVNAMQGNNGANPMSGLDPRVSIIADAEDALEGSSDNPEQAIAAFVEAFGPQALELLKAQVQGGMTMRGKPRMIEGPGGPKDDAIPAVIDGKHPAALSDGEFVMPAEAVAGAGGGDRAAGAESLTQLADMLGKR